MASTQLYTNLILYAVYCGLMKHHSQEIKQAIYITYTNGHWRTFMLFTALHFKRDLKSIFGPELYMIT
jgi:hypothetical protein